MTKLPRAKSDVGVWLPGLVVLLASLALVVVTGCASSGARDADGDAQLTWEDVADVAVIEVVTTDEDGDVRETPVWFVLLDGSPYLRTNDSRWLDNLRRDPHLDVRVKGHTFAMRAEEIGDDELIERVEVAAGAKYGFQDGMIRLFRVSEPEILKLHPAERAGTAAQ